MHLRRALLLFALVLGLSALAASIAPAPRVEDDAPPAAPAPPATGSRGVDEALLRFRAPVPRGDKPPVRRMATRTPVEIRVSSDKPGQVAIPELGRTASVTATVPARFDLLVEEPGRLEVLVTPTGSEPVRVGILAVER